MNGTTHLLAGITAGVALSYQQQLPLSLTALCCCAGGLGGLLPDLDHKNSTIAHKAWASGNMVAHLTTHRGFLHTPVFAVGLLLVLQPVLQEIFHQSIPPEPLLALLFGMLSHLLLDMLNPAGIPLFYPLSRKRFHLLRLRSHGKSNWVFGFFCAMTTTILLLLQPQQQTFLHKILFYLRGFYENIPSF